MKNIFLLSTVLLSALAEAQWQTTFTWGIGGERGQVGSGSNRDDRGQGYNDNTVPLPTWSPLPTWEEDEPTWRPSSTSRRPSSSSSRRPTTTPEWPTWEPEEPSRTTTRRPTPTPEPTRTTTRRPTTTTRRPSPTLQQPTWSNPQPTWNQPQLTWGGNGIPTTWYGQPIPTQPNWGSGGFQFPGWVPTASGQPWNPQTPYKPNTPILCDACPQTFCLPGENECECANTAALSCWVQTGFSCLRPQLRDCGAEIPPTDETSEFPPCGYGYASCASGTTCDTSATTGCFDVFGFGDCIGVCIPAAAPYVPDSPAGAVPTTASTASTATTAAPPASTNVAPGTCRGIGYDVDCPAEKGVCIGDPKFPPNANVPGVCVSAAQSCGGVKQASCGSGKVCLDDPRDQCDPTTGEGCLGICV